MKKNDESKNKRKRFLIYPRFQWTLIAMNSAIMLVASALVIFQAKRSFQEIISLGKEAGLSEKHPYFSFVDFQSNHLFFNLAIALGITFVVSIITTLLFSHKIAGPLVRLKNYFNEISKTGELKPIEFRKGDYILDIAPAINKTVDRINSKQKKSA